MDRETILNISRKFYLKRDNLTTNEVDSVISSYCIEKGKKYAETQLLLYALYKNPPIMNSCFIEALTYFEKKFTIFKLLSDANPLNNNLLNNGGRTILLIY